MNKEFRKVLFSEDLKNFVEEQTCLFDRKGFQIFTASSAEDALAIHRDIKVDLIVVDIDFPQMGGDGLCSMIRENPALKRVYVSLVCFGKKVELQRCVNSGADSYIKRPPKLDVVTEKICRILDNEIRKDRRLLIKVTMHGTFKKAPFFCVSRDISASGMLLEADKTLAKGDRMQLSFMLPDKERINLWGEVVRVTEGEEMLYRYGLAFLDVLPELKEAIEAFIKEVGAISRL
jgi:response regulator RpfG family c-di-GMP phosphodiesterase